MQIFVSLPNGKTCTLEVDIDEKVQNVINKVEEKHPDLIAAQCSLLYNEEKLSNDDTLDNCGIYREQTLKFQANTFQIFAKLVTGRTVTINDMSDDLLVGELRQRIADKEAGVDDPCQLRLIFCGKQLKPEDKLSDYRITKGATIMVVQRLVGGDNTGETEIEEQSGLRSK